MGKLAWKKEEYSDKKTKEVGNVLRPTVVEKGVVEEALQLKIGTYN